MPENRASTKEEDSMKRFSIAVEVGKPRAKKRQEKAADKMVMAEVLARCVDRNFLDSLTEAGMGFDSYVDSLNHIWAYSERGQYDLAIEMMYVLAMAIDDDAEVILEQIIMPDADLTEMFLNYFGEYITDGYMIDRIIARCEPAEDSLYEDDKEPEEQLYDVHYEEVKDFFKKEDEADE